MRNRGSDISGHILALRRDGTIEYCCVSSFDPDVDSDLSICLRHLTQL